MIIAVLHDVLEDSDIKADDLKERGFSDEVLMALDCLTRRPRENRKVPWRLERAGGSVRYLFYHAAHLISKRKD